MVANEATAPKSWGWSARTRRSERVVACDIGDSDGQMSTEHPAAVVAGPGVVFVGAIAADNALVSPELISQVAEQSGTGMGDDALAAGGHRHIGVEPRVTLHFGSALLDRVSVVSQPTVSIAKRAFPAVFRPCSSGELLKGPG